MSFSQLFSAFTQQGGTLDPESQAALNEIRTDSPELPNFSVAQIQEFIPELQLDQLRATQTATIDTREILSRQYFDYRFDSISPATLERINLARFEEVFEADFYFQVVDEYAIDTYESSTLNLLSQSAPPDSEQFRRWRKTTTPMRREGIYKPTQVANLDWFRPNQLVSPPDSRINPTPQVIYAELPNPFTLPLIDSGQNIAAEVISDGVIEVRTKSDANDEGEIVTDNFLLFKRFIEVTILNPTDLLPTFVTINFFGEFLWNQSVPAGLSAQTPSFLIHPPNTPREVRLKPPGFSEFPDSFWNSNNPPPEYEQASDRPPAARFTEALPTLSF